MLPRCAPLGGQAWSMLNRRHHCRLCGAVVCDTCSKHRRDLPSEKQVNPRAKPKLNPLGTREYPVQRTASVAALEIRRVGQVKSPSSGHKRARIHDRVAPPRPGRSIRNRGRKGRACRALLFRRACAIRASRIRATAAGLPCPQVGLPNQPANPSQRWPASRASSCAPLQTHGTTD